MKPTRRKRPAPQPERPSSGHAGEVLSLVLFAAAVLTGLALATHDAADASLGLASADREVGNAVGPFGANLSLILLEAVGVVAYGVPLTLLALAVGTFLRRRLPIGLGRLAGGLMFVLASAAVASLALGSRAESLAWGFPPGGFLGRVIATGMESVAGPAGAWVVALTVAGCSLLFMTRLSLRTAAEGSAHSVAAGASAIGGVFGRAVESLRGAWRRRSEAAAARRAERALARRPRARAGRSAASPTPAEVQRPTVSRTATPRKARGRGLLLCFRVGSRGDDKAAEGAARASGGTEDVVAAPPALRAPAAPAAREAAPAKSDDSRFLVPAAREVAAGAGAAEPLPTVGQRATIAKALHRARAKARDFRLPPTTLLHEAGAQTTISETELQTCAQQIVDKCAEFGIGGRVLHVHPGPVVTTFELKPDAGIKLSRICGLEDDLAMALKAETIRIDRIPGKSTIGIEVPNSRREIISFRQLAESDVFEAGASPLTMILGKTIDGAPYVADLARMPHLLIAGSTGSGKSVALNSMITSMLFKATPDRVKLIMVDPKMLELGMYADIPHLLTPVVTNPKLASNALKWAVKEMENRYARLAGCGVRNIEQYNAWVKRSTKGGERPRTPQGEEHEPLPFLVIIIDELADLMMIAANDVEDSICRLAQMARAVGIHLILATQRPSVDVITGVIKANLPARIAMRVASKVDSRTILDANGAEQLLGKGDMLFLPSGSSRLMRLHGPYLSEVETAAICDHLRTQLAPVYDEQVCEEPAGEGREPGQGAHDDDLFEQAARLVVERGEASVSYLQRRLKVGYSRAARLVDMLEEDGIVGPSEGSKVRQVLVGPDYFGELDRAQADGG